MKYAGMPMGMWALYRRSFRDQMVNVLGFRPQAAAAVMRRAKPRYREIIARLPEFEKADRFKMNEVNCALFSAVLLSMPEKPDIDKLADYYEAAMMTKPTQWFCRQGGRRKFTGRDVRAMEETARLKAADRNPYSWNMELYPYADGSGYEARFTKCGICTLMRELGLYDAVPAMCRLDYAMSKAGGASTFVREFTLASGGPYCDCGYKKKTRKIGPVPCCRQGNAENPSIKETPMKADYKNWVPKGMLTGFAAGAAGLAAGSAALGVLGKSRGTKALSAVAGLGAAGCGAWALWCAYARSKFSYDGKRKLSKQIVEGTAEFVTLPEGGVGLDVGCGSGALTIACAKRNPQGRMVGCDAWGPEYASFSQQVCEQNAAAEGVENVSFRIGNAKKLPFADGTFDAVTSNYVYHNVMGVDKQKLLLETLRVLKKGGTFAIHDIMSEQRYGDMRRFCDELRAAGYEEVELIDTTNGLFMSRGEAATMFLTGSAVLRGRK